jgi:hypothetical protein
MTSYFWSIRTSLNWGLSEQVFDKKTSGPFRRQLTTFPASGDDSHSLVSGSPVGLMEITSIVGEDEDSVLLNERR